MAQHLRFVEIECLTFELSLDQKHFFRLPPAGPVNGFLLWLHAHFACRCWIRVHDTDGSRRLERQTLLLTTRWTRNTAGTKFIELLLDFGLTQCVQSPTRFSRDGTSCSVIDLYSTNRADLLTNIDISDPVSDHCMVTARLELSAQRALPSSGLGPMKVIYDFRNVDWHKINKDLMNAPLLQAIQGTQDVECALAVWESTVILQILGALKFR